MHILDYRIANTKKFQLGPFKQFISFRISTIYFGMDLPFLVPQYWLKKSHGPRPLFSLQKIGLNPLSLKYQTIQGNEKKKKKKKKKMKRKSNEGKRN